ncbi:MAG: sodium:calcium antiporter [Candidatus Thermoplasmatota archaeon]|nr:sodium:calcium antiporter [Candidatus Thermoplasmatota archaeon]
MVIPIIAIGFVVLNQGAKFITDNALALSRSFNISRFVIGMLVVSTLAAMPEVLVSLIALGEGSEELALGNGIASNVVTIAFVIGLTAVMVPLKVTREMIMRDAVFLMTVTIVASVLLLDCALSFFEGVALMMLFIPYTMNLLLVKRGTDEKQLEKSMEDAMIQLELMGNIFGRRIEIRAGPQWLVFGILWTVMGAEFVVRGALTLTDDFGIDPWLLGISVVALGTTLPDIAASFHAARRGFGDLALGEGIGASIVTVLLTLGLMGITKPFEFGRAEILPLIVVLNLSTFLVLVFMLRGMRISQIGGVVLMSTYFGMVLSVALLIIT